MKVFIKGKNVAITLEKAEKRIKILERALLMVKEELCFGGNWKNATKKIDSVLKDN